MVECLRHPTLLREVRVLGQAKGNSQAARKTTLCTIRHRTQRRINRVRASWISIPTPSSRSWRRAPRPRSLRTRFLGSTLMQQRPPWIIAQGTFLLKWFSMTLSSSPSNPNCSFSKIEAELPPTLAIIHHLIEDSWTNRQLTIAGPIKWWWWVPGRRSRVRHSA